jgi:SPP1 family predicted phage head-tail adaptor
MKNPLIGELRHRAELRCWRDTPGDDDATDSETALVTTVWAKIEPVGGATYVGSTQIGAAITHRITFRYRADVTASFVVTLRGRLYRVRRVTDLGGEGRFTVLECEEEGDAP